MSQSEQFDNQQNGNDGINTVSDTYTTESREDIYRTPDISMRSSEDMPEEAVLDDMPTLCEPNESDDMTALCEPNEAGGMTASWTTVETSDVTSAGEMSGVSEMSEADSAGTGMPDTMTAGTNSYDGQPVQSEKLYDEQPVQNGQFSGEQLVQYDDPYRNSPYSGGYYGNQNSYGGQSVQNENPYGSRYVSAPNGSNPYENNTSYGNYNAYMSTPSGNSFYGGQPVQNENLYGGQPTQNENLYSGQPAQNNNLYGGRPVQNNNLYGGQPMQNNNLYGGQPVQNGNPYNGQPMQGGNLYSGQQAQNYNAYSGQPMQNGNQYGVPPYGGNNQFSPYAVPAKKNNTGLIIGIVAVVGVLFLVAIGVLTYKVVSMYTKERENRHNREEYNFDDWDRERERKEEYNHQDDDDHVYDDYNDDNKQYDDYDYNDGYDDDYDYDSDEYYTLHDDIRSGLSYDVEFEYYEYDSSHDNVDILVLYPVIKESGGSIPNLDKLNATLESEIDFLVEYYEEEYGDDFVKDNDSYFHASSTGYVTYMDEEKMSIVFSENVYADDGQIYYADAFLYSINIDMENGIILENESMLSVDDAFSVEFREKSDIQNGEISSLTRMTDQEMTSHFDSSDIIVFYTPQGMEIGFNYDEGWVTVTYKDYKQYLKVF